MMRNGLAKKAENDIKMGGNELLSLHSCENFDKFEKELTLKFY